MAVFHVPHLIPPNRESLSSNTKTTYIPCKYFYPSLIVESIWQLLGDESRRSKKKNTFMENGIYVHTEFVFHFFVLFIQFPWCVIQWQSRMYACGCCRWPHLNVIDVSRCQIVNWIELRRPPSPPPMMILSGTRTLSIKKQLAICTPFECQTNRIYRTVLAKIAWHTVKW